jgi:branched-chain amino acid transport system ATP-binding protein
LLEIENFSVSYGAIKAVVDVSLSVSKGEVVALLGANGAGKTSLLRAVSGLERSTGGRVIFDGGDLKGMRADQIVRRGLAHCPEGRHIFPDLTVRENLDLGGYMAVSRTERDMSLDKVVRRFPILERRLTQKGGSLSGGEQQMLAVGRALMSSPRLLMLDEPSLGLAPKLIDEIFDIIRHINEEEGVAILLVEQNANEALRHADRAYVLENGRITMQGSSAELLGDHRIVEAYLGG